MSKLALMVCFLRGGMFSTLIIFTFSQTLLAQVKMAQWSDVHSSLERLADQVLTIDQIGQDYLLEQPDGEFIVFINGDFTSINSLSRGDKGHASLLALKKLRERGYTVIFTPGNHDAFDWAAEHNEAELFLEQMKLLHDWGVIIMAANLDKPTRPLKSYLTPYYRLNTIEKRTYFLGLTINRLMSKSNLLQGNADSLFKRVLDYEKTLKPLFKKLLREEQSPMDIVLGAHESHQGLSAVSKNMATYIEKEKLPIKPLLYMAGDDHLVASYKTKEGSVVSDGGAQGSFNTIEISKEGVVLGVDHHAISEESVRGIDESQFTLGKINRIKSNIKPNNFFNDYVTELNTKVKKIKDRLSKVLFYLKNSILTQKHDMKKERKELGSLLAEALVSWAKDELGLDMDTVVLAFVNSSSYRLEEPLQKGAVTEYTVREMYPFLNKATVYRLTGEEIQKLFKILREHYASTNHGRYTPQLSFDLKETDNGLKLFSNGKWKKIRKNSTYFVALDGWLSEHRFGESYQISEWVKTLTYKTPMAVKAFQDILVDHLPDVMFSHGLAEEAEKVQSTKPQIELLICKRLL